MNGRELRRAAILAASAAILATGCGLSAELDREADPARTGADARPPHPASGPPVPGPPGSRPSSGVREAAGERPPPGARNCPASGIRVSTGMVSATMGLRAMPVTITNCGTRAQRLNGYPDVRVRDVDHRPMDVTVLKGPEPITRLDDPGPHPVPLRPGESARSVFVWRYSAVDAASLRGSGVYVEIGPSAGADRQTVEPEGGLDIGETGLLGTTAWTRITD
ncbi:DUF4232 domain-containing protein [Streptomyces sp. HNM0645]|uniref:DUF4232 domain-containing protein n=1 Tax=Streptomyces sp. HNM0645 TaxID=2782343 RepID=UPI0024B7A41E|nr:DUF4232 domain-containing protein [Streptomyces sp. HNM0645]MDI9888786.1 DUF4232 domain-containing protein [Streptomyces sp. HNM0645]